MTKTPLIKREIFVTERLAYRDVENKHLGKMLIKEITYGPSEIIGYVVEDEAGMEKRVVHYKSAKTHKEGSPTYLNGVIG